MTAALDAMEIAAIREAALLMPDSIEGDWWSNHSMLLVLAALDRAEAVVVAAREYLRFGTHHDLDRLRDRLRAYEDADKEGATS